MAIPISKLGSTLINVGKQIEFAGIVALTRTAVKAQKEVRKSLEDNFILRNKWTARGIRITPAKKGQRIPFSEVFSVDWYIAEHETGKKRSPAKKKLKAHDIPVELFTATKQEKNKKISKRFSANAMLKKLEAGQLKKLDGGIPFVARTKKGWRGIFLRRGSNVDILYKLQRQDVDIEKKPWFFPAVNRAYNQNMEREYSRAITEFLGKIRV